MAKQKTNAVTLQYIPFEKLVFLENNPRTRTDEGLERMAADIKGDPTFYQNRPTLVNLVGGVFYVYAGDLRAHAAHHVLGWAEIPCNVESDVPADVQKRRAILDNTHREEWDRDKLSEWGYEADELEEMGVWMADMEDSEGGVPNNVLNSEAKEDEEFEPTGSDTDIKMGDVFEIRHEGLRHRIVCADSTQISSFDLSLYGSVADLVFTDPDFSMDFDSLIECYGNCKKYSVGNQFWVCGDKQAVALASNDLDTFTHFFIQDFRNATLVSNTAPMTRHCMIVKFGKPKMNNLKDGFMTILEIATARILKDHKATPMAKRIALPFAFISHYMTPGQTVLDCFAHSGSTMMAAQQFGVNSANIEIEPRYCQFMIDRFRFTHPDASVEKINIAPIA